MHDAAYSFVGRTLSKLPARQAVLEVGGRNINGSIRPLFSTSTYLCIDLIDGVGVDRVADIVDFKPDFTPDTVVCCGVLEHSKKWAEIVKAIGRVLAGVENGVLILTCTRDPWPPHSAVDGGPVREGEYYKNVDPLELTNVLDQAGFARYDIEVQDLTGDMYVLARVQAGE